MEVYSLSPSKAGQSGTSPAGLSSLPTNLPVVRTRFTTYTLRDRTEIKLGKGLARGWSQLRRAIAMPGDFLQTNGWSRKRAASYPGGCVSRKPAWGPARGCLPLLCSQHSALSPSCSPHLVTGAECLWLGPIWPWGWLGKACTTDLHATERREFVLLPRRLSSAHRPLTERQGCWGQILLLHQDLEPGKAV